MRSIWILISSLLLLSHCGDGPHQSILTSTLIREDDHLGEYLQIYDEDRLVTVRRNTHEPGLVLVSVSSGDSKVLDSTAGEARDIKVFGEDVAYRVGSQLRLWRAKSPQPIIVSDNLLRLTGFLKTDAHYEFAMVNLAESSTLMETDFDGQIVKSRLVSGEILETGLTPTGERYVLTRNQKTLLLTLDRADPLTIAEGDIGIYSRVSFKESMIWIAYFDQGEGCLKLARRADSKSEWVLERVDGTPGQTYRGHDIAAFEDNDGFGYFYLDAWSLKLRMARRVGTEWKSSDLDIPGAVGFYTQVLNSDAGRIRIAFHAFRSDHPNRRQSFEDLHIVDLKVH